jgi:hypothetical protein
MNMLMAIEVSGLDTSVENAVDLRSHFSANFRKGERS